MKVEDPAAFYFIMQDELYLLNKDKNLYNNKTEAHNPVVETAPVDFNYLGANKKNLLIIVHYPDFEFMDEKHLTALESTMKRLGFSVEDTAVFNLAAYGDVNFEHLLDFFKPRKMVLLGALAIPQGMEALDLNKPKQTNKLNMLLTFSFDEMMDNTENKKIFWEQMKQL